jgi:hypothetical protein
LTIEFFLRILIFNQKMQKSLDFGPESFFVSSVHPVGADALDTGAEMVAKGIGAFMTNQAEQNLNTTFGVTFANDSDANMTPSQKLVYMISNSRFEQKHIQ